MTKKKIRLGLLLFILMAVIVFRLIASRLQQLYYSEESQEELSAVVENPYCGWYQIFEYQLSDEANNLSRANRHRKEFDENCSLVLLEFDLQNYNSTEISDEALSDFNDVLAAWANSKQQMILRFAYDYEGNAKNTEPASLSLIQTHMNQLAPYVNAYKNYVYICQGLFVGNWGEMHSSAYANKADFLSLMSVWSHDVDSSIFLAVRTPEIWRQMVSSLNPISSEEAYSGSLKSRLSLYNDGMLGSITDVGTYDEDSSFSEIENYVGKGNRQEEIAFQNSLCLYVPNGGEVMNDNEYNDIENAVQSLSDMHVSYLNIEYDEDVINKWKTSEYKGENGFNYISKYLGYRYVIQASDLSTLSLFGHKASYEIYIENAGFAPAYKRFTPSITLVKTNTKETKTIELSGDNRYWMPGEEVCLSTDIDFSEYEDGYYDVYFNLRDSVCDTEIYMANQSYYEEYGYLLGRIALNHR